MVKQLLKKLFFFVAILFIIQTTQAKIVLIEPLQTTLENNDIINLGEVSPGETIELVISNDSGKALGNWHKAYIDAEDLPSGWKSLETSGGGESLVTRIKVPMNAKQNKYNFRLKVSNPLVELESESFQGRVFVKPDLLNVSLEALNNITSVNKPIQYKLVSNNESVASHLILIKSNLPLSWFTPKIVKLTHNTKQEAIFDVNPQVYGLKKFKFEIYSYETGEKIDSFETSITVLPTLKGKYLAAMNGLPLFTVSLMPFHVVNSLIGLILP